MARALASAVALSVALVACTSLDTDRAQTTDLAPSSTAAPATSPATAAPTTAAIVVAAEPCAIATGCVVPAHPTTFDVQPLPEGWTIADATAAERGPATSADAIVRVLTTDTGERVWVTLLPDEGSPVPTDAGTTLQTLEGGWTAYVNTDPMRNYPPDVVESAVAVRLRDDLVVLARAMKVPPDDVVAAVQGLVIS